MSSMYKGAEGKGERERPEITRDTPLMSRKFFIVYYIHTITIPLNSQERGTSILYIAPWPGGGDGGSV